MKKDIFIVDDEKYIIETFENILSMNGYNVTDVAFDGEEAIQKFKSMKERPDVTIMDHRMPIKNGIDAMRDILDIDPTAKVLFISADISAMDQALKQGAMGFLLKPFKISDLLSFLKAT